MLSPRLMLNSSVATDTDLDTVMAVTATHITDTDTTAEKIENQLFLKHL